MKAVLGLLLVLVPFVWFYVKHYSKKLALRMETNLYLDRLYEALLREDAELAMSLYSRFFQKFGDDIDYAVYIGNLPATPRNSACISFMRAIDMRRS